ncbi:general secretion pathway protein GspB [Pontiellaceae bacterium B1224]|nr:general secretion pathway protein GspB [Pontiellaceae bacterium B1224]
MQDKILLLLLALCLTYGGYKLISSKMTSAESSEAATVPAAETPAAVAAEETPAAPPPEPEPKVVLPPKMNQKELIALFRVDGFAKGTESRIVMINNAPLREGETLDGLKIEKILANQVEVSYKGHTYQLTQQLLPNSFN